MKYQEIVEWIAPLTADARRLAAFRAGEEGMLQALLRGLERRGFDPGGLPFKDIKETLRGLKDKPKLFQELVIWSLRWTGQDLEHLDLRNTQVSDLSPLAGLTNLRYLYLSRTQVSDLRPLAGLTRLRYLYLSGTQVEDLSPLAGLRVGITR